MVCDCRSSRSVHYTLLRERERERERLARNGFGSTFIHFVSDCSVAAVTTLDNSTREVSFCWWYALARHGDEGGGRRPTNSTRTKRLLGRRLLHQSYYFLPVLHSNVGLLCCFGSFFWEMDRHRQQQEASAASSLDDDYSWSSASVILIRRFCQ